MTPEERPRPPASLERSNDRAELERQTEPQRHVESQRHAEREQQEPQRQAELLRAIPIRSSTAAPPQAGENPVERELRSRAERVKRDDPVGAARAQLELGILFEWVLADRTRSYQAYSSARALARMMQPALTRARRVAPSASDALEVLEDEIGIADSELGRADLFATRARLLEMDGQLEEARLAYVEALRFDARHPASAHGLEVILRREIADGDDVRKADLSDHLAHLSELHTPDGTGGDALLAAWIHVERAELLERTLTDPTRARECLRRAVALVPQPGPVRMASVRHLARYDRETGLASSLRTEAERESDPERSARLLYTAARIILDRGGSRSEAMTDLFKAEHVAPPGSLVGERILGELASQLEADNDYKALVDVRGKRLALLKHPEAMAFEYVRLADAYGRLGRADLAADAATHAAQLVPKSRPTREVLDSALMRLGRHADRVRVWIAEANAHRPTRDRVLAYLRAAEIATKFLNQPDQAVEALRGAWLLEPGNAAVFDALSALLQTDPRIDKEEVEKAEQRIDLFEQAAAIEPDRERKIGLYDKVLTIWEDELDHAEKAMQTAEKILALDPKRRSAILALGRNARRAGATDRLSRALTEEAELTTEPGLKVRLLLQAAEIFERKLERDRALLLIDRALAAKPTDIEAGRARVALLKRMNRLDEARKTLIALVDRDKDRAFETWLEVAELDETLRKSPTDAVDAYRAAHALLPEHPFPSIALIRLLRSTKNHKRLVSELKQLSRVEQDARQLGQILIMTAEVEEHCIGDDEAALKSLDAADEALGREGAWDPSIFESEERILFRLGDDEGLLRLYARWLERKPSAAVDHVLRVGLAGALEAANPLQAVGVLEALVAVVPHHLPALRKLQHLYRARGNFAGLANVLFAEASLVGSRAARQGALWEVVTLEDKIGVSATLDALARIVQENPNDLGAHDAIIRIGSRLLGNVAMPHPALVAARNQLLAGLRQRRELTQDPVGKGAYLLEEAVIMERPDADQDLRGALDAYRGALMFWPDCTLAARGLERIGSEIGDAGAVIESQRALARLTEHRVERAAHLIHAADLMSSHLRDERGALELYQSALDAYPESREAVIAVSKILHGDPRRLIEILRATLARTDVQPQVTLIGGELAKSYLRIHEVEGDEARLDFTPAILAFERAMRPQPDDIPSLFTLSKLYVAQRAWGDARDTLSRVVDLSTGTLAKHRVTALFAIADLYEGPFFDKSLAEDTLRAVLDVEPSHKVALERLYTLGKKHGDPDLARQSLERLAESETDLAQRTEYQLRVAEVCREANDGVGMLRAVSDAVVSTPNDLRPWTLLSRLYRADTSEGALGLAKAIGEVLEMARARRKPQEARWLYTLGLLEVNMLGRPNDGLLHLQAAVGAASKIGGTVLPELRAAYGLGLQAAGRSKESVSSLRELLTADADALIKLAEPSVWSTVKSACVAPTGTVLSAALLGLETALAAEGRPDEKLAVEELRSFLGDLPSDRSLKLQKRRLDGEAPVAGSLLSADLARALIGEARSPWVDVGVSLTPILPKILGLTVSSLGVQSRDKIGPRDGHPTRALLDRLGRALGLSEFELYLSPAWTQPLRVFPGDPPVFVGPASFSDLPEIEQAFALSRSLARLALGTTFLDDVPAEGAEGIYLAALRSVFPNWGLGELSTSREHLLQQSIQSVQKAIGRKQRKIIEERAGALYPSALVLPFLGAARRSEYRVAYLMTGDLQAGLETMRKCEPEFARGSDGTRGFLASPLASEFIRYALGAESQIERRRIAGQSSI